MRDGQFCHCLVANSLIYLCAKNYQNRTWMKLLRVQFLPHSVGNSHAPTITERGTSVPIIAWAVYMRTWYEKE